MLVGGPDIWINNGTTNGQVSVTNNNNRGLLFYWRGSDNAIYFSQLNA